MCVLPLYLALVHYPVVNKHGEIVTTAITTFDIHDGARTGRTFGVKTIYYVTPVSEQERLMSYFKEYWSTGLGAKRNPSRREAMSRVAWAPSIEATIAAICEAEKRPPFVVASSARPIADLPVFSVDALPKEWQRRGDPLLVLFGTGYGLSPEVFSQCAASLAPIVGADDYNHLPVRAAMAIYLHGIFTASKN